MLLNLSKGQKCCFYTAFRINGKSNQKTARTFAILMLNIYNLEPNWRSLGKKSISLYGAQCHVKSSRKNKNLLEQNIIPGYELKTWLKLKDFAWYVLFKHLHQTLPLWVILVLGFCTGANSDYMEETTRHMLFYDTYIKIHSAFESNILQWQNPLRADLSKVQHVDLKAGALMIVDSLYSMDTWKRFRCKC